MNEQELQQQIEALRSEIEQLRGMLATDAAPEKYRLDFNKIRGVFEESSHKLLENIKPLLEKLDAKIGEPGRVAVAKAGEHVAERPFTYVLLALGMGVILGKILDCRCSCHDDHD